MDISVDTNLKGTTLFGWCHKSEGRYNLSDIVGSEVKWQIIYRGIAMDIIMKCKLFLIYLLTKSEFREITR